MARKKTARLLNRLNRQAAPMLKAMVAELTGETVLENHIVVKPTSWSRRFAASGKSVPAPQIRS